MLRRLGRGWRTVLLGAHRFPAVDPQMLRVARPSWQECKRAVVAGNDNLAMQAEMGGALGGVGGVSSLCPPNPRYPASPLCYQDSQKMTRALLS